MTAPIVAGTDGSEDSLAAVEWAAGEAAQRRVPLRIVHVLDHHPGPAADHAHLLRHDLAYRFGHDHLFGHDLPHRARSVLARARHRAAEAAPGIGLQAAAVFGRADQVRVAGREEQTLVPVPPADKVRRRAARAMNLDDHARPVLVAHVASPHRQLIAHVRARIPGWLTDEGP